MRFVPIVAVISETDLARLRAPLVEPPPTPEVVQALMDRNGWTHEAMAAGVLISIALDMAGGS